jgi:hypothetical protein
MLGKRLIRQMLLLGSPDWPASSRQQQALARQSIQDDAEHAG